jgi:hypothetical protein
MRYIFVILAGVTGLLFGLGLGASGGLAFVFAVFGVSVGLMLNSSGATPILLATLAAIGLFFGLELAGVGKLNFGWMLAWIATLCLTFLWGAKTEPEPLPALPPGVTKARAR